MIMPQEREEVKVQTLLPKSKKRLLNIELRICRSSEKATRQIFVLYVGKERIIFGKIEKLVSETLI